MTDQRKTLLILGSMDEFVLLVQRAKERGCRVLVADGYEQGPARAYADASFTVPATSTETLAHLCREHEVGALITSFSDTLFEAGCQVAYAAGLAAPLAPDKLECLRDKERMKEMFSHLGIPYPHSRVAPAEKAERACDGMRFPCVVKPLDGYGSYGVRVVRDADEVRAAAYKAAAESRRAAKVVLEEYDEGREFNMITWISKGRAFPVSIADREKSPRGDGELPHVSRIVYPSRFAERVMAEALRYAQRVADFAGIVNGPLFMQLFWSPESGMHVCEVAGRVFGYEHELLEYASGLSVEDLLLDTALDHEALAARLEAHDALAMEQRSCGLYFHMRDGIVANLAAARTALDAPYVQQSLLYYAEGDVARNARGGKPYAARAFLAATTYEELDVQSEAMFARFSITGAEGEELAIANCIPGGARNDAQDDAPTIRCTGAL